MGPGDELEVRAIVPADWPGVLALLELAMGWVPDGHHGPFLAWKHQQNVFGPSPGWVALDGGDVVGFRAFLRWDFESGTECVRAVRAVDTATHPQHRGRGIFSRLTRLALKELSADGFSFVFNTPNHQSGPGYLKMGWETVGRLPVWFRPRRPGSLVAMARARVPAGKWSVPTSAGVGATEVLADHDAMERLLGAMAGGEGLRTRRTPAFLAWRYGFAPLAYRAILAGPSVEDGVVVFRLRQRGPAIEAAVCEVLVPGGDRSGTTALLKEVVVASGADYAVRLGGAGVARLGFLPLPRQGPTLMWRGLAASRMPPSDEWQLGLGDVELL